MKTYNVNAYGNNYEIVLFKGMYSYGDNLAVVAEELDGMPFATLSVNLDDNLHKNFAYIDTNNCPWATEFLETNKIAVPTGKVSKSGFCIYPLYEFNLDMLENLDV